MGNGKKVIIIPVGITVETAKGFLSYVGKGAAMIGVYLDDGKFMDRKRSVLEALELACGFIGIDYYEYGVKPGEYRFAGLIHLLNEMRPQEVYLETVTGPRMLSILMIKVLYEYTAMYGVRGYLILGVEGEETTSVIKVESFFSSAADLGLLQRKLLSTIAERGEVSVGEVAHTLGTSRWTLYKTVSSLIERGLMERAKRGLYRLTPMGLILTSFDEDVGAHRNNTLPTQHTQPSNSLEAM